MKTLLVLSIFSLSVNAFASAVPKACYKKAAAEVVYKGETADTYSCEVAPNKAVILCEVAAYKGGGDATDTYLVVLTKDCKKVLRSEMLSEE